MTSPYQCRECGRRWPDDYSVWRCACGAALSWDAKVELPILDARVRLGEGRTRLFEGEWLGRPVWFADEGGQPTGSFKDRGVVRIVSHALDQGITTLGEDSSGNAGASFAAYCARAGIECQLFAPAAASPGKLAQARALGAGIHLIEGSRDAVALAAQESAAGSYAGHNWHPLFIEGVATLAWDLLTQGLIPERIVVPVGNGSLVCGLATGFSALLAAGRISRMPQLIGVQSQASNAIYRGFTGLAGGHQAERTIAEGIAIRATTRDSAVIAALRDSHGGCLQVSDKEIVAALRNALGQGLFIEPTAAAALAGLTQLQRMPGRGTDLVTAVVLTGSGLKAAEQLAELTKDG